MQAVTFAAIVACLSCGSKDKVPTPSQQKLAAPPAEVTGPHAALCSPLIPVDLRGGLDLQGIMLGNLGCMFKKNGKLVGGVAIDCARGLTIQVFKTQKPSSAQDIAGLGRIAWRYTDVDRVEVFASKVDCTVGVTSYAPGAIDTTAVATAVDTALDAKTAPTQPLPPRAPGLRCDRYLPAALRTRAGATSLWRQAYTGTGIECVYGPRTLKIHLECAADAASADARLAELRKLLEPIDETEGPAAIAVGRNGFKYGHADAAFIDPDTNCIVNLSSHGLDPADAAKDIEAAITPAAIAP